MRRLPLLLLVPASLLAALTLRADPPAEPPPTPVIDLHTVSPESLGGVDVGDLVAGATEAYRSKRYEEAARGYVEALRRRPGNSEDLYNLACCLALLGDADQAARFLEAAWKAGFHDLGHVRSDPDFDGVREDPAFAAVVEELAADAAERATLRGELVPVVTETVQTVRVLTPPEMDPWRRYPLVVGLHGWGADAEGFARLFRARGVGEGFLYCVPQAPYAFPVGDGPGYSWTFMGEGGGRAVVTRSHLLTERYVLAAIEAVKLRYPVDEREVFLLGFSQGAGEAFSIGMKHPELFRGVIPIGGWLDAGEHPDARARHAAEDGLFLVCHSPEDARVAFARCEEATAYLVEHGIPHAVLSYSGGHSIPAPLAGAIASWIEDPRPAAPSLEPAAEETSGD